MHLVNQTFPNQDGLMKAVMELATRIAKKSPLTIRGIKDTLNYSKDHSVTEGLAYVAAKNAANLFSDDLTEALLAMQEQRTAKFKD